LGNDQCASNSPELITAIRKNTNISQTGFSDLRMNWDTGAWSNQRLRDFFEIVSKRYEKVSTIITSSRSVHEWDKVFIDKTLTTAVVDRLLHHCSVKSKRKVTGLKK
jgi:IstB-like ATP binding protein